MPENPISDLPPNFEKTAPVISTTEVPTCNVCGSAGQNDYSYGYDYELQTCANLWKFVECSNCGMVRLNPRPSIEELSVIYPPTYYAYNMSEEMSPIAIKGKFFLDNLKFKQILKNAKPNYSSFLDIGCGDGKYLNLLGSKYGLKNENLYGLELDDDAVEKLRKKGYRAYNQRVEECQTIKPNSIDIATMFHVIEHVDDPQNVLKSIHNWLTKDGILAIETPNIDSWDARLFKKTFWGGYHIPRHWHIYNTKSLKQAMENAGYEVVAIKYQTGHSFWLYSFHHLLKYNARKRFPNFSKRFDPCRSLFFLILFTGWDKLRGMLGFKTSAVLMIGKKK